MIDIVFGVLALIFAVFIGSFAYLVFFSIRQIRNVTAKTLVGVGVRLALLWTLWVTVVMVCAFYVTQYGTKHPAYETEPQKFSWGSAYVWMSIRPPNRGVETTSGEGYILINTYFYESVLNKNCAMTIKHVSMTEPDTGVVLIDETSPSFRDGSPMTKDIKDFPNGQFSFHDIPFKFDRDSFPYDVKIKIDLNCPNAHSEHEFSKQIRFYMKRHVSMMP